MMSTASTSLSVPTGSVLVVDDEPHMGTICAQTLRLDAHSVQTTTDPLAALELLQRSHFDVLLTDISMPEMSGLELAHRAHLHQPAIGVVMMTGYASYENMAAALRQGVADFLPKPFEMAQLRLTITRALQRQRLIHENVRLQSLVDLLEASQQFSASLDPTRISSAILRAIQRVSGMNCVHVNLVEADTLVDSGVAHDGVCMLADARSGLARANVADGERRAPNVVRFPLNAADEHVGEVVLATEHAAAQTRVLTAVVQMLANHGAVALHNARLYAARAELVARGIDASPVYHCESGYACRFPGNDPPVPGPHPNRGTYGSFVSFSDPDGNGWVLQEVTARFPGRVDGETAYTSPGDLSQALKRASAAHGEHEVRTGEADAAWPEWYAEYMVREQSGAELPR